MGSEMCIRDRFPAISDHILAYSKTNSYTFNRQHKEHAVDTLREWYIYLEFQDGTTRRMTKEEKETQSIPPGHAALTLTT